MGFVEFETVFGGAPRTVPWSDVGFLPGLFNQRPLPDGQVEFTNRIVILEDGHEVAHDEESRRSWPLSAADRRAEARATGTFTVEDLAPGYVVARLRQAQPA